MLLPLQVHGARSSAAAVSAQATRTVREVVLSDRAEPVSLSRTVATDTDAADSRDDDDSQKRVQVAAVAPGDMAMSVPRDGDGFLQLPDEVLTYGTPFRSDLVMNVRVRVMCPSPLTTAQQQQPEAHQLVQLRGQKPVTRLPACAAAAEAGRRDEIDTTTTAAAAVAETPSCGDVGGAGEEVVTVLPVVLGRGAFGRVFQGR